MAYECIRTADDDAASLFELVTQRFRDDVFSLLDDYESYLEEADLPRIGAASEEQLLASREAHRIAIRLKDLVARTLSLHAWSSGEITTVYAFSQANRLQYRDYGLEPSAQGLPEQIRDLAERSAALYQRTCELEDLLLDLHDLRQKPSEAFPEQSTAA